MKNNLLRVGIAVCLWGCFGCEKEETNPIPEPEMELSALHWNSLSSAALSLSISAGGRLPTALTICAKDTLQNETCIVKQFPPALSGKSLDSSDYNVDYILPDLLHDRTYSFYISGSFENGVYKSNTLLLEKMKFEKGMFIDARDGQSYKTVKIGNQWWMAENLKFNSLCYKRDCATYGSYGGFYYLGFTPDICPNGWQIPTISEMEELLKFIDNEKSPNGRPELLGVGGVTGFDLMKAGFMEFGLMSGYFSSGLGSRGYLIYFSANSIHDTYALTLGEEDLALARLGGSNLFRKYTTCRCIKM